MGAITYYIKDGYKCQIPSGGRIPWPVARLDEEGNEIPLSWQEIEDWRKHYRK